MTDELVSALVEILKVIDDRSIRQVFVFGSQLTSPSVDSDVDVLVVRCGDISYPEISAVSQELGSKFWNATGRRLDQTRLSETELVESGFLSTVDALLVWERS